MNRNALLPRLFGYVRKHTPPRGEARLGDALVLGTSAANFRELCKGEVRRIPFPRTPVNRGTGACEPRPGVQYQIMALRASKSPGPIGTSLYDAEGKMRYPGSLDHPGALQLDRPGAQMVEHPDAVSEQDGHQVDVYLVEESRSDALLHQARADHADVLVARDRFGLLSGAFEAVRDEPERRSFVNPLLWDCMTNNKDRYVQGVSGTPPIGEVECPAARHQRPCRCACLAKELGSLRRDLEHHLATRQPVFGVACGVPRKEPLAALTRGCIRAVVGPSDKAVQRR